MKIIIQKVPSRNIDLIKEQIPDLIVCEAKQGEKPWETWLRSLEMAEGEAHVHLEDDITLAPNFLQELNEYIRITGGDYLIQFFSRRKEDLVNGTRFRAGNTFAYNCCFYIPEKMTKEMLEYMKQWKRVEEHPSGYDVAIADFLNERKLSYVNIVPSLVQHNITVSTLDRRRARDRTSQTFWRRIPKEQMEQYKKMVNQIAKDDKQHRSYTGHKYNGAIDRVNISKDKKYIFDNGNGFMMQNDLFDEIPKEFYNADYVITDPPYNDSAMKSYYKKAEIADLKTSGQLFDRIFDVLKEIKVNACYMECSVKIKDELAERMSKVFDHVRVIDSFYYKTKPCCFVIGENDGHILELDQEPKDELLVIDEIIKKKNGTVLDFCLGRGAVSRTAYKHDKPFIGTELNINRLAVSMEDILKKGAKIEEVDK